MDTATAAPVVGDGDVDDDEESLLHPAMKMNDSNPAQNVI
jgi:hypothetical protein